MNCSNLYLSANAVSFGTRETYVQLFFTPEQLTALRRGFCPEPEDEEGEHLSDALSETVNYLNEKFPGKDKFISTSLQYEIREEED